MAGQSSSGLAGRVVIVTGAGLPSNMATVGRTQGFSDMDFDLELSMQALARTPGALHALLDGLPAPWTRGPLPCLAGGAPRSHLRGSHRDTS